MIRRIGGMAFAGGGLMAALLCWRPVHDAMLRLGWLAAVAALWGGALALGWKRRWVRTGLLALPVAAGALFLLPGREVDGEALRSRYLDGMRELEGVRYVWGGESGRGIDCSGLPRLALRRALLEQAARGNGRALRMWAEQWWFDTSALAMKEGYRGFTRPTGVKGAMRGLDLSRVEPGDLAVTSDGRHVMIHLGGGDWIQADPMPGEVIVSRPEEDDNAWFNSWVTLHRWSALGD